MTAYAVTNPATGERLAEYPTATDADIESALAASAAAFQALRSTTLEQRCAALARIAELHEERKDELAAIITREMGKPVQQALGEIWIVGTIYRFYAEQSAKHLAAEELEVAAGGTAVVRKEGLGPLLGIMPWNYPFYQVARFAAPNLAIGNTILLKHAPQCPESALAQAQIIRQALEEQGLPADAYVNVFATNEQASTMIADPRVAAVSLTGSERAGSAVAEQAGRHLKKCVLELGGSDPFIVLDAADVDRIAKRAVFARMTNAGQACNASKRFIVPAGIYDEFVERFTERMRGIEGGDPTKEDTFMGPLSSEQAAQGLLEQVERAKAQGATIRLGGGRINGPGAYFQPTVITDVTPEMDVFREELFGPVAVIYKADSVDEAVELANATPFGLGASVHSDDVDAAAALADRLEAGMVHINEAGGSSAELPFGGVKRSGFGRELGKYALAEFVNEKLVRVKR